jgi:hypothetical protein
MSFGMYLVALFCPPLYFAIRGRWIAAAIHAINWLIALFFVMSILAAPVGVFLWVFSAGHACWDLSNTSRQKHIEEQAEAIARKMTQGKSGE